MRLRSRVVVEVRLKNCFWVYSHSVELLISMFHSILTFDFDLILGFFGFLRPYWAIFGLG